MRKYQQLVLAILSFLSFSCLLIYRHEYNKLHYVLEVLNFFGSPGTYASRSSGCNHFNTTNTLTRGPLPAWQRISDSFYVYSAFLEKVNNTVQVKAYGIGIIPQKMNYRCFLWYERNPKTKIGVIKFSELKLFNRDTMFDKFLENNNTKPFIIHCKPQSGLSTESPIGVTFFQNLNNTNFGSLPVFSLKSSNPFLQNSTGVCVMPADSPEFNKSIYLEFLHFHKIIGINNFFIYGGIDHYSLLSSVQNNNSSMKINILPWNYPFYGENNIMKIIAEEDCKSRLKGLLDNVVILEWNKFLVPRYLFNISELVNELNVEKDVNKFLFSTLLFCTDYRDEVTSDKSLPIIFKKMKYVEPKVYTYVPLYKPHLEFGKTQHIKKSIIAIHYYAPCNAYKSKMGIVRNVDKTILKYKNEFFKSQD